MNRTLGLKTLSFIAKKHRFHTCRILLVDNNDLNYNDLPDWAKEIFHEAEKSYDKTASDKEAQTLYDNTYEKIKEVHKSFVERENNENSVKVGALEKEKDNVPNKQSETFYDLHEKIIAVTTHHTERIEDNQELTDKLINYLNKVSQSSSFNIDRFESQEPDHKRPLESVLKEILEPSDNKQPSMTQSEGVESESQKVSRIPQDSSDISKTDFDTSDYMDD